MEQEPEDNRDRYSKRVSMERIAEEGFNLNISRYISTAVAEEEIDLDATQRDLIAVEEGNPEGNQDAQLVPQGTRTRYPAGSR